MQTKIHTESLMITLGLRPVPEHMYRRQVVASLFIMRRMTEEERINLLCAITKHKTNLGNTGTAEFIYYEMLEDGELPSHDGVNLVTLNNFFNYYKVANYKLTGKYDNEKKTCVRCGEKYERRVTIPINKWNKQRFCSKKCACLDTVANRTIKQNERKQAAS